MPSHSGLPDEAVEAMAARLSDIPILRRGDYTDHWLASLLLAALPAGVYRSDGQGHVDSLDPSHSWSWAALRASASDCERAGLVAAAQTLRDVSEALFPVLAALSATDTEDVP